MLRLDSINTTTIYDMSALTDWPRSAEHRHSSSTSSSVCFGSFFEAPQVDEPAKSDVNSANLPQHGVIGDVPNESSASAKAQSRHVTGTRLFTITERASVTTMKTLPSNGTFQRRIFSAQHIPNREDQLRTDGVNSLRRRDRFSLDEDALQKLHVSSNV